VSNRISRLAASVLVLLFIGGLAKAHLILPPPITEMVDEADVVAFGQIQRVEQITVKGKGEICGIRYTATVLKSFKDSGRYIRSGALEFYGVGGLDQNAKYVFFLHYQNVEDVLRRIKESSPELFDDLKRRDPEGLNALMGCGRLVTGLTQFERQYYWEVINDDVVIPWLLPTDWPDDLPKWDTDKGTSIVDRLDLFSYIESHL
jgi:hypothetical protein